MCGIYTTPVVLNGGMYSFFSYIVRFVNYNVWQGQVYVGLFENLKIRCNRLFPNSNDAMQPRHENEANHDKFIISMADEEERRIFLTLLEDSAKEIPLVLDQVDRDFEEFSIS